MKYGYFDDNAREYVITTPKTPLPWINYLGTKDFFTLISNTGGGYSFYKDAKLLRITRFRYNNVPTDQEGLRYYIKDEGTVWNPGWQPTQTPLDFYACRHGMGYTRITGEKNALRAEVLAFVPVDESCLLHKVTLKNVSNKEKTFTLFSYMEFCLWNAVDDGENFQRNLSVAEVEVEGSAIYHKHEYRERRNHFAVFSVDREIDGFDTDRDSFVGLYNSVKAPQAVENGQCANSMASGWAPVGAHQLNISLAAGEETSLVFMLAYVENKKDEKFIAPNVIRKDKAYRLMKKFAGAGADEAFKRLREYWDGVLGVYHASLEDERAQRMVNIWNQYQCMVTFNLSRSASYFESGIGRGMGFRDSCQDILGFVHMIPERAKERIRDIAATQHPDGSAYHQYQPLTKKGNADIGGGFNDDPLWLIACVYAYVCETGDVAFLSEKVPFDNGAEPDATLFEHLKRSFDYTVGHKGPHGLPLIGRADWNDCLNLNCFSDQPGQSFQTCANFESGIAESVFIAGLFVYCGARYADICRHTGMKNEAAYAEHEMDKMRTAVMEAGWDGKWFLRAYDGLGGKVGSQECEEGQIYIEPQGMCVMAGLGTANGRAQTALDSVKERLDTAFGIMLHQPAYTKYHIELGEITSYPPGYKENAGIFCHNNPWVSIAETVVGDGERAFEIWEKTAPACLQEKSDIHRTEPYVYSQMVAGRDAVRFGEAKNSWLTGTAAWTFVDISQHILGVRPCMDGLMIDPCIPKTWTKFTVERVFRGAKCHIHVHNENGAQKGVKKMTVNGETLCGQTVHITPDVREYEIDVEM